MNSGALSILFPDRNTATIEAKYLNDEHALSKDIEVD